MQVDDRHFMAQGVHEALHVYNDTPSIRRLRVVQNAHTFELSDLRER